MQELNVGQAERKTQNRIIELFVKKMGYVYLGSWEDRENSISKMSF